MPTISSMPSIKMSTFKCFFDSPCHSPDQNLIDYEMKLGNGLSGGLVAKDLQLDIRFFVRHIVSPLWRVGVTRKLVLNLVQIPQAFGGHNLQ